MIGLTDRVQPWARRFQRAPRDPVAPQPETQTADETQRRAERRARTDTGDPATTTSRRKTHRVVRRALHER